MNKWHRAITAIMVSTSAPAFASQLVYHPINPALGGNPLNGSSLLATAQAQGEGTKSGQQQPDLSGLDNALSNLGNTLVVSPNSTSGGNNNSSTSGTTP